MSRPIIKPNIVQPNIIGATKIQIIATDDLPVGGRENNGLIVIEDSGPGDQNLIIYAYGKRYRIDGGSAF